jgi:hypothetical protein
MKRTTLLLLLAIAALGVLPSCSTNVEGDEASPVFLTIEFTLLPLQKNVADGTPLQFDTAVVRNRPKSNVINSTTFLDVRLETYDVEWRRLDGGTKVPEKEIFAGNVIVPFNGTSNLTNYQFMTGAALGFSPFDQLFPFNGGLDRETGRNEIRLAGIVTLNGHTLSGQPVRGSGTFDMTFVFIPLTAKAR